MQMPSLMTRTLLLPILLCLLSLCTCAAAVAEVSINGVRSWTAPERTRLVFDITSPVKYDIARSADAATMTLLIHQSQLKAQVPRFEKHKLIASIAARTLENNATEVKFRLKSAVRVKSFQLDPGGRYGYRLVVDLYDGEEQQSRGNGNKSGNAPKPTQAASAKRSDSSEKQRAERPQPQPSPALAAAKSSKRGRDIVIAIDAGHGGEDSGARGSEGTNEKDVVLAIAIRLEKLLEREGGMRGVLVRKSDYYIPLRERMQIARRHHADFFVSIHADAFPDSSAKGSSVYVLSNKGASSEAAHWLAKRENQADLVGGVSLDDKDEVLASVLLDLSQAASRRVSYEVAQLTVRNLRKAGKVHFRQVQKAGFAVLKSPDIPSMLVETAFISNPQEEQKLLDPQHQEQFAKAILAGIKHYFHRSPPADSWLARRSERKAGDREYVIVPGDTLSEIAERHQVSLSRLKDINELSHNEIRAGQVLKIPAES
jgi:N-acetylmuramoyl-L-alanine amidase